MAMDLKEIEKMIKEALPDASVDIQDLAGDGNHYSATRNDITMPMYSERNSQLSNRVQIKVICVSLKVS